MSKNFVDHIEQLRRRLLRRRLLTGVCWVFVATAVVALMLIAVDRALDINDRGMRVLTSILLVVVGIGAVRRWLVGPSRLPLSRLSVALEIEDRYPKLRDLVSSAVEFFKHPADDPLAGSKTLRRAVVMRAAEGVDEVDWEGMIRKGPLRKAGAAAIMVAILLGFISWLAPEALGIGFTRLLNPLANVDWPREHDLVFIDPPKLLAAGSQCEFQLRDQRDTLPEAVNIHYRQSPLGRTGRQSQRTIETEPMIRAGEVMIARRTVGQASFEFRATGGDHHTMPWQRVEVRQRPRIDAFDVTAIPPDYTGKSAETIDQPFRILVGTSLILTGQASEPLSRLRILGPSHLEIDANLGHDNNTFSTLPTVWKPTTSGPYWFEMTTPAGLIVRSSEPISLEVVPDRPPTVTMMQPTGDLKVVADAQVDYVIGVTDDLGIRDVSLVCRYADRAMDVAQADEEIIILDRDAESSFSASDGSSLQRRIAYTLDLTGKGLQPGEALTTIARATDYYPNTGRSAKELRLSIISHDELLRQLQTKQSRILDLLAAALAQQRNVRSRVADWRSDNQSGSNEQTIQRVRSEGHSVLYSQRNIADMLVDSSGPAIGRGIVQQIDDLLQTMYTNRHLNPTIEQLLGTIRSRLFRLANDDLPTIEQRLSDVVKRAEHEVEVVQPEEYEPTFAEMGNMQEAVIAVLEKAFASLARWNTSERIAHDLAHLQNDQKRLLEYSQQQLAAHVWNEEQGTLEEWQQEMWNDSVAKQRNLSHRFGNLVMSMDAAAQHLAKRDPSTAMRLNHTAAQARKLQVQATLQSAAEQLSKKRIGLAMSLQRQALQLLEQLTQSNAQPKTEQQMLQAIVARLKLLRQKQGNLRERTRTLEEKLKTDQQPNKSLVEEARALADQQRKLQELANELISTPPSGEFPTTEKLLDDIRHKNQAD